MLLELKRTRLVPILRKESRKMYKKYKCQKIAKECEKSAKENKFYVIIMYMVNK